MHISEIVSFYSEKMVNEEMEFGAIRKEIIKNHLLDEEQITGVLKLIDKKFQEQLLKKSRKKQGMNELVLGTFSLLAGLIITLGTFFGFFGNGKFYFATVGLIGYGSFTMFNARRKMNA